MLRRLAESSSRAAEALPEQLDEERNRVVARLAGAVAHKLKQPLTVALGFLELVLDDPELELDAETLAYLGQAREALDSMDDVVNRLQDATHYQTRPYAGTLEILDIDANEAEEG
jgi:signal transduction histidine kinase